MARSLERDYEMPPKQAEGVATLVYRQLSGNVATKEDIASVRKDITNVQKDALRVEQSLKKDIARLDDKIADLKENMATKADIAEVRTEISSMGNRTVAILGGLIGFLFIVDKILPFLK